MGSVETVYFASCCICWCSHMFANKIRISGRKTLPGFECNVSKSSILHPKFVEKFIWRTKHKIKRLPCRTLKNCLGLGENVGSTDWFQSWMIATHWFNPGHLATAIESMASVSSRDLGKYQLCFNALTLGGLSWWKAEINKSPHVLGSPGLQAPWDSALAFWSGN